MTTSTITMNRRPQRRRKPRHALPVALGIILGAAMLTTVIYLLWPTWHIATGIDPSRLPVSVGGTPFNVQLAAVRIKAQRRTGQQERIDLAFLYPSLATPPATPAPADAASVLDAPPAIDRIFLSLLAHRDALAPEDRIRNIYPRYLEGPAQPSAEGLVQQAFGPDSPYRNEDLFKSSVPGFVARCTRDGATPGMCMSERRIGGADATFRFPRSWLAQWRSVSLAMDDLVTRLQGRAGR